MASPLPARLITHWAYLNTVSHPPTAKHACERAHTHRREYDALIWGPSSSQGGNPFSLCLPTTVPHHSLSFVHSTAVMYTPGHAKAVKPSEKKNAAIWCAKSTKDGRPDRTFSVFWFLKPLHFLFYSISVLLPLLKPRNSSSSWNSFFFLLLSPPTPGLD